LAKKTQGVAAARRGAPGRGAAARGAAPAGGAGGMAGVVAAAYGGVAAAPGAFAWFEVAEPVAAVFVKDAPFEGAFAPVPGSRPITAAL